MTKERRLGRGLEALLGRIPGPVVPLVQTEATDKPGGEAPYGGAMGEPYEKVPEKVTEKVTVDLADELTPPSEPENAEPTDQADPPQLSAYPASDDREPDDREPDDREPDDRAPDGMKRLSIDQIDRSPFQPRQDFDPKGMQSLSESIETHGLLQPLVVRRVNDRYELVAGERRLRAAAQAGWTEVPANVLEVDDRETAELAIVENLQRKDLNPLEKAASFRHYLDQYGCTQEELASRLQLDRSTVANLIRLLELPEPVQEAIRRRKITQGHARALLPLGEEREQIDFCRRIEQEHLNVRQTESLVQEMIERADAQGLALIDREGRSSRPKRPGSKHLAALEQELRAALGMKVKLTHTTGGRGKLTIHFRDHDQFEALRRQLTDPSLPGTQPKAG